MLFLDTNILIYLSLTRSPLHERACAALVTAESSRETLTISSQVLREFLSATTGSKLNQPPALSLSQARYAVTIFMAEFHLVEDGLHVWRAFDSLLADGNFAGKQIHDAYLVATMLAHDIPWLLTHNIRDFQRFVPKIKLESI